MASYTLPIDDAGNASAYGLPGSSGPDPYEEEIRRQQEAALEQHRQYSQYLQQAKDVANTRQHDLDLSKQLLIATDINTPKSIQKFMLRKLSNAVGVDPNGDYSKQIQAMVAGLEPEAMAALRASFGDNINGSRPGAINEGLRGIFDGTIPVDNLVMQINQDQQARVAAGAAAATVSQAKDIRSGSRALSPGDSGVPGTTVQAPQPIRNNELNLSTDPTAEERRRFGSKTRLSGQGQFLAPDDPADPDLMALLQLRPPEGEDARNRDINQNGFPGAPHHAERKDRLVRRIMSTNNAVYNGTESLMELQAAIAGNQEALGVTGTFSKNVDSVLEQINAGGRMAKEILPDMVTKNLEGAWNVIADKLTKAGVKAPDGTPIRDSAYARAKIEALVLEAAHNLQLSRMEQEGKGTDWGLRSAITEIGVSASRGQFTEVLKHQMAKLTEHSASSIGGSMQAPDYYHNLQGMPREQLDKILKLHEEIKASGQPSILSERMWQALNTEKYLRDNPSIPRGREMKLSGPTLKEERATEREGAAQAAATSRVKTNIELEQNKRGEAQAKRDEERLKLEKDREDRNAAHQKFQEEMALAARQLQIAKDARAQEKERHDAIAKAFQSIASALMRHGGIPGLGGGGIQAGGEDASAFRMTPAPQRQAPSISNLPTGRPKIGKVLNR